MLRFCINPFIYRNSKAYSTRWQRLHSLQYRHSSSLNSVHSGLPWLRWIGGLRITPTVWFLQRRKIFRETLWMDKSCTDTETISFLSKKRLILRRAVYIVAWMCICVKSGLVKKRQLESGRNCDTHRNLIKMKYQIRFWQSHDDMI